MNLRSLLPRIKDKLDIKQVLDFYGITYAHEKQQQHIACPFHGDQDPSFYLYPDGKGFRCFGCGQHGDVISFIQLKDDCDFKTAIKKAARIAGIKTGKQDSGSGLVDMLRPVKKKRVTHEKRAAEKLKDDLALRLINLRDKHEMHCRYNLGFVYGYILELAEDLFLDSKLTRKKCRSLLRYTDCILAAMPAQPQKYKNSKS